MEVAEVTGFHTEIKRQARKTLWILQGLLQIDGCVNTTRTFCAIGMLCKVEEGTDFLSW